MSDEITALPGIGPSLSAKFISLGIKNISDLINYYPRRYEDYSSVSSINKLRPGNVSIKAEIKQTSGRYVRRRMHITEAIASDETGSVRLVWFNQPYRAKSLKSNTPYFISGNYELSRTRFSIMNPAVEMESDFPANTARILAIYRETKGLDSRQIRLAIKKLFPLIDTLDESLPDWILNKNDLISRSEAIKEIHMPSSSSSLEKAKRRLGFEEVFQLILAALFNKDENQREKSVPIKFNEKLAKEFVNHLPFKLTDGQRVTVWQTYKDMQKNEPMNRLIEGDVGSGKTVVAAMAALMVLKAAKQAALMAPTELLARQHAQTIHTLLKPLGYEDRILLLVGSMNAQQKKKAHEAIESGKAGFIIGTQSLIQEKVNMKNLALTIIDEQHRFGVEQRKSLMAKAGHMPHVLTLTATPIPRSLALTLYGEMDVSLLKQMPAGRQQINTKLVSPNERERLFVAIDKQLEDGQQMFVVCPSISESETLDINSAEKIYALYKDKYFKHRRVGLLHGKLKTIEKNKVMEDFLDRRLDIIVATTVIEVGVDIPNASIMLIQNPERFGLAQLHQLRGRVGRGEHQGHCYLMLDDSSAPSKRLRALISSQDGFRLSELDLELRGPGAIYGTVQHGSLDLRLAKLTDTRLIMEAKKSAVEFMNKEENLLRYKELALNVSRLRAVTNLN